MLASMARQDVAANNLANVSTVAFKPDELMLRRRDAARIEDQLTSVPPKKLLERLGAGVMPLPTTTSFGQGALRITDSAHDLAIEGDGFFLVDSTRGGQSPRLTRDGRLALGENGRLEQADDGSPVLSEQRRPIMLDPAAPFTVTRDGCVCQHGAEVARLALVQVSDTGMLRKETGGRFAWRDGDLPELDSADGRVVQGALEESAMNPIEAMLAVTAASSAAQSNARMLQIFDELMGKAITGLGRVA
jgi:flagellar basal body rod protein FlgG